MKIVSSAGKCCKQATIGFTSDWLRNSTTSSFKHGKMLQASHNWFLGLLLIG